ncbi:hypothetical protein [Vibrio sp. 99-70-13A1]|uniref:hypothetical protein n=1 Tax=Vibrio sp. 99-70-13A1 TaxID=2607601 RepID=UPI001493CF61|nr:hypothetical protein [Vibrio sp. 99-70-13A1]NOH95824.1 hypothetical protein [Vibrio sp. 99-70-13A1]
MNKTIIRILASIFILTTGAFLFKNDVYEMYLSSQVHKGLTVNNENRVVLCGHYEKFDSESVEQLILRSESLLAQTKSLNLNEFDLMNKIAQSDGELTKRDKTILMDQALYRFKHEKCITGNDYHQEFNDYLVLLNMSINSLKK